MARVDINELYARYIKPLEPEDRLRLVGMIAHDLALAAASKQAGERSLLELEGLGAEIWQGIDAQVYVDELRKEWDERP